MTPTATSARQLTEVLVRLVMVEKEKDALMQPGPIISPEPQNRAPVLDELSATAADMPDNTLNRQGTRANARTSLLKCNFLLALQFL
jgi:hypothetical protein